MKKLVLLTTLAALLMGTVCTVSADTVIPEERVKPRLVDDADLLMDYEEEELLEQLDEISERQQFDVAVVTVESLDGQSPQAFADDYYDYNGYGMGEGDDGALLLISMEERDWYITTYGYGIVAITDVGLSYMSDRFVPYLSDGDYFDAFTVFAELCDEYVTQANEGEAYDSGNLPAEKRGVLDILIAVGVGAFLAFIPMLVMVRKMKNVQMQSAAGNYVQQGSIAITEKRDRFLYDTVVKTKIEKSSSGSSTHRSSSGRSHGGGGGKF